MVGIRCSSGDFRRQKGPSAVSTPTKSLAGLESEEPVCVGRVANPRCRHRHKREIKLVKSTSKVNLARARMGLPVPVTSPQPCCLGAPGTSKTSVARAFTKQLCGLTVLREPLVVETSRAKLLRRNMADAEKNSEKTFEGR